MTGCGIVKRRTQLEDGFRHAKGAIRAARRQKKTNRGHARRAGGTTLGRTGGGDAADGNDAQIIGAANATPYAHSRTKRIEAETRLGTGVEDGAKQQVVCGLVRLHLCYRVH
jgi:hypothetical protein